MYKHQKISIRRRLAIFSGCLVAAVSAPLPAGPCQDFELLRAAFVEQLCVSDFSSRAELTEEQRLAAFDTAMSALNAATTVDDLLRAEDTFRRAVSAPRALKRTPVKRWEEEQSAQSLMERWIGWELWAGRNAGMPPVAGRPGYRERVLPGGGVATLRTTPMEIDRELLSQVILAMTVHRGWDDDMSMEAEDQERLHGEEAKLLVVKRLALLAERGLVRATSLAAAAEGIEQQIKSYHAPDTSPTVPSLDKEEPSEEAIRLITVELDLACERLQAMIDRLDCLAKELPRMVGNPAELSRLLKNFQSVCGRMRELLQEVLQGFVA